MSDAPPTLDPMAQLMMNNLPDTVEDMRRLLDGFAGMFNVDLPAVGAFHEDVPVEGCSAEVSADVIVPEGEGAWPVLVYLHGGGWVCGSPRTHKKLAHRFAEAGYLVFNIDYRMAPEHPFPTPLEDCVEAIRWASRIAEQYGGNPSRLAVGGDSAGGNLSAAASIALRDDSLVDIRAALLIYGVFDFGAMQGFEAVPGTTPEMVAAGEKLVEMMVGSYLGGDREAMLADPRVSPIHGAHHLPPSHIVCGSADPLVGQTRTLAQKLGQVGIEHEVVVVEGMPHGFAQMEFFPQARQSIDGMVAFLGKHLA